MQSIEMVCDKEGDQSVTLRPDTIDLSLELDVIGIPYKRPTGYIKADPIRDIKATDVRECERESSTMTPNDRYQKLKPLWLQADIRKAHLGKGEPSSIDSKLSQIIRERGNISSDDCGHIIGNAIGGKMIDVNLFPQNRELNRGHNGNYKFWKRVESTMQLWLFVIPEIHSPRVQFQMLLYYDNVKDEDGVSYPDRPDRFKYLVEFLYDGKPNQRQDEEDIVTLTQTIFNVANITLQCPEEELETLQERVKTQIVHLSDTSKLVVERFLAEICGDTLKPASAKAPRVTSTV